MPIRSFLERGHLFDDEAIRIMGLAYEFARSELRIIGKNELKEKIATKIIELAATGERDPDKLCDFAIKGLLPLRRVTTQLRCRPLFLQTEAPAPSPSVRGFFLPRKTPPARVCATGSFQVGGSSRSQRDWSRAPSRTLPRRHTAAGVLSYRGFSHY
jgi:hypothetical protein